MKIVVVQSGPDYDVFPLMSLLIGLHKNFSDAQVTWIGNRSMFDLVRFNRRVQRSIPIHETDSLDSLKSFFGADLLINPSRDKAALRVAASVGANKVCGFTQSGPADRNAEFFDKIVSGKLKTNRHVLDLYYSLVDLRWKGEGYGLPYYPKTKQTKGVGCYLAEEQSFRMPDRLLAKLDAINEYSEIVTDDLFICHAAIALRKKVTLAADHLPYQICFFGRGSVQKSEPQEPQ